MEDVYARLQQFMGTYVRMSDAEWARTAAPWEVFAKAGGEALLREGKVCDYVYFLDDGLMRYHYADEEGVDRTKFFTEPPYVFTAQRSFNGRAPSREAITAVTASRGLRIRRAAVDGLLVSVPPFASFVRLLVAEVQGFTEDILVEAQTLTAEERYGRMLHERPALLRALPLKYLASYLGVAPQSLSRIRRRVRS